MKIGIDTYSFDKPGDNFGVGPGVYVWHLLPKLVEAGKEHTYYIFCNKENENMVPRGDNIHLVKNALPNKIRALRILHEQIFIPIMFEKHKMDMVHYLGNNISYALQKYSVLTVYDLMWKYYLDRGEKSIKYQYFNMTVPASVKMAKEVITISKYVAGELHRNYKKPESALNPILLAAGTLIDNDEETEAKIKKKYPYKYIYTVTTSMPHKNLKVLMQAFKKLKIKRQYGGKLVITGQLKGAYYKQTESFIKENRLEKEIIMTGFISEEEKSFCYKNADMMVYPSLYEGFGLPVLEAMAAGTPVVASQAASIPEVGGDACIYFDPESEDDLCVKILGALRQKKKSKKIEEGKARAMTFTWKNVAERTLAVYEKIGERR